MKWLRWVTFGAGVLTTTVATFGAGLPIWLTVAGPFIAGLATNAEKIFASKKDEKRGN